MAGRTPTIKFLQRIRDSKRRQLIQTLTREVWDTPDCCHFTDVLVKNPLHTSHSDPRPHITVRMRTEDQIARGAGQTVHIFYNSQTEEYEAFALFSERQDKPVNDEPKAE
ncbi:Hypothetical protein R9X50_00481200 [Acrodontium crateriforme]|uniref:Uncharacterized protein n=1 Tax=Acrodontium crateriforme TaxID=150365 RepID=A0AAQ3M8A0_9PEZI|nr:Hypothetical protein R9X50_00481200 [Acrodontium crateriforme]